MDWLTEVIVDIIVTLFIAFFLWLGAPWMWWVIAIYTVLLLVAKGLVLTGEGFLARSQKSTAAPQWFHHLLYAVNTLLLALAAWWYLVIGWGLIWLFSFIGERKK